MRTRLRLLPLLLVIGAVHAADTPAPPAPGPGASSVEADEVSIHRTVRFPGGVVAKAEMDEYLQVGLRMKADPSIRLSGQIQVVAEQARTDAGEELAVFPAPSNLIPERFRTRRGFGNGLANASAFVRLACPARSAASLTVSGTVVATCEGAPGEVVTVAAGQSVEIAGQMVRLEATRPGECRVVLPKAADDRVGDIRFLDASGAEIGSHGFNGLFENGVMVKTYRLTASVAVAQARITQAGADVEVRVPFSFQALPLSAPPAAHRRPAGQPAPAPAPTAPPASGF